VAERRKAARTPALEWAAAGVGLLLLLTMLAIIGMEAVGGETEAPPAVTVAAGRIVAASGGYVVEIEAGNSSGAAAAAVQVEGALMAGDAAIETSSLTFDYLPGHSRRKGGLFFTQDPRRYRLDLRALGYQEP
jgi:uncharacterized protein (TIGR02588 family)